MLVIPASKQVEQQILVAERGYGAIESNHYHSHDHTLMCARN